MRKKTTTIPGMGSRIQMARVATGSTQAKLSEKINVSTQFISDLERSVVGASVMTLQQICTVCGVSSDFILFGNPDNKIEPLDYSRRISALTTKEKEIMNGSIDLMFDAFHLNNTQEHHSK